MRAGDYTIAFANSMTEVQLLVMCLVCCEQRPTWSADPWQPVLVADALGLRCHCA